MLIYIPKITNRIKYIFHLIFNNLLKIDYDLTEDLVFFKDYKGPKLNYSKKQHLKADKAVLLHAPFDLYQSEDYLYNKEQLGYTCMFVRINSS